MFDRRSERGGGARTRCATAGLIGAPCPESKPTTAQFRKTLYRAHVRIAVALLVGILSSSSGCKPPTEEDRFRLALGRPDVDAVREHLDAGKDPKHVFADGSQPIHKVAEAKGAKAEVLRLLVERGADVHATDGDGKTAWQVRWGDPKRKLFESDATILVALLEAGAKPDIPTPEDGRALLHEVARRVPSVRLVSLLVDEHGQEVDARDDYGWTALHVAVHEHNVEAATGLLEKGADANAETTKILGHQSKRHGKRTWSWKYESGSRPLDVYRSGSRGRGEADVRKVVEQYGGKNNPSVDNRGR